MTGPEARCLRLPFPPAVTPGWVGAVAIRVVGLEQSRMSKAEDDETLRGSYRDVVTHKLMLQDVVRTSAYADAIVEAVGPETRVIDFGSGTGALAIFAARAGAARVDAIERTCIVEHAREVAKRSGHPEIVFHRADHESFIGEGLADLLVSEWMGHFLFFESMLEPLISIRDRWLKPAGAMIPASISLWAALVIDEELYEDGAFLENRPYGIDFGPIADLPLRQSRLIDVEEHQLLAPYIGLGTLDMRRVAKTPELLRGKCIVPRSVTAYGMVGWFDARLTENVSFGTGPDHPHTHWRPIYFPFPEPFDCRPARPITISIRPPSSVELKDPAWAWGIRDESNGITVDERDSFARCRIDES